MESTASDAIDPGGAGSSPRLVRDPVEVGRQAVLNRDRHDFGKFVRMAGADRGFQRGVTRDRGLHQHRHLGRGLDHALPCGTPRCTLPAHSRTPPAAPRPAPQPAQLALSWSGMLEKTSSTRGSSEGVGAVADMERRAGGRAGGSRRPALSQKRVAIDLRRIKPGIDRAQRSHRRGGCGESVRRACPSADAIGRIERHRSARRARFTGLSGSAPPGSAPRHRPASR